MAAKGVWRGIIPLVMGLVAPLTGSVDIPPAVFDLNEVSVFEIDVDALRDHFVGGQRAPCMGDPCSAVSAYPAFASQKPLYGSVRLPCEDNLDKSGAEYCFALDESKGTGTGYDRLFFDGNRNHNLTDDMPLMARLPWPTNSMVDGEDIEQQVVFPCLSVSLEGGPEGMPALELLPRLTITDKGYKTLSFVTTKAHTGQITIAGRQYQAYLGHNRFIGRWFDRPETFLRLVPSDPSERPAGWIWSDRLMSIHKIDGRYWQFAATPAGDRLTVKPYQKAIGTFEIGSGGRGLKEEVASGVLRSRDGIVAMGGPSPLGWPEPNRTCQLPEGDYQPVLLSAQYGPLRMHIEPNYFGDGRGWDLRRSNVYGIQVRKGRPFILDFSAKPVVLFAAPALAARFKRGDTLNAEAFLIDPKLDIVISDVYSLPQERVSAMYTIVAPLLFIVGLVCLVVPRLPREVRLIGGVPIVASLLILCWFGFNSYMNTWLAKTYSPHPERLETAVVVARTNGQRIAQGSLPFEWRVPQDLDLKTDQEVFTIKVTFDTQELYGKVKGTRQVTICR